eukprot:scaffold2381_cov128-Cylindrotheca_fusiformis.AAC.6
MKCFEAIRGEITFPLNECSQIVNYELVHYASILSLPPDHDQHRLPGCSSNIIRTMLVPRD